MDFSYHALVEYPQKINKFTGLFDSKNENCSPLIRSAPVGTVFQTSFCQCFVVSLCLKCSVWIFLRN